MMNKNILVYLLTICLLGWSCLLNAQSDTRAFTIGEVCTFYSASLLEERVLNVYLPSHYASNSEEHYNLIVLLDGSADEDFIHTAGVVQFCNFPWIESYPNSIVVGISNIDRRRDFTYPTRIQADKEKNPTSGGSTAFLDFMEKELIPFVEAKYRTNGSRAILGQSLGGFLATHILLTRPAMFNEYIIVSPSIWWDDESVLEDYGALDHYLRSSSISVYLAVGNEGRMMKSGARKLHRLLKNLRIDHGFEYFGKNNHADIYHQALYNGFNYLGKARRKRLAKGNAHF